MSGSAIVRGLLLAGIVLMPLMQPGLEVNGHSLVWADLFLVPAVLLWLVQCGWNIPLKGDPVYWPLVAYCACCVLSAIVSGRFSATAPALAIDLYMVALAVLVLNVAIDSTDVERMVSAWLAGAAISGGIAALGGMAFFAGWRDPHVNFTLADYGTLVEGNYPRIDGTFLNYNMAGNYFSVSLLLLLAYHAAGRLSPRVAMVLALLLALAAGFSASPALGGLLLGVGIWGWLRERAAHRFLGRCFLAGGIASGLFFVWSLVVSPAAVQSVGLGYAISHPERSARVQCWQTAVTTIRRHPLAGLGPGTFMPCPAALLASGRTVYLGEAHNTYLNIAALKGLPSLAAFLWFLWACRRRVPAVQSLSQQGSWLTLGITIAFLQAVVYQGLANSFEHTRHLWVLTGLLLVSTRSRTEVVAPSGAKLYP